MQGGAHRSFDSGHADVQIKLFNLLTEALAKNKLKVLKPQVILDFEKG